MGVDYYHYVRYGIILTEEENEALFSGWEDKDLDEWFVNFLGIDFPYPNHFWTPDGRNWVEGYSGDHPEIEAVYQTQKKLKAENPYYPKYEFMLFGNAYGNVPLLDTPVACVLRGDKKEIGLSGECWEIQKLELPVINTETHAEMFSFIKEKLRILREPHWLIGSRVW